MDLHKKTMPAEEILKALLEPAFKALIFNTDYNVNFTDVAYTGIMSYLIAGLLDSISSKRTLNFNNPSKPDYTLRLPKPASDENNPYENMPVVSTDSEEVFLKYS